MAVEDVVIVVVAVNVIQVVLVHVMRIVLMSVLTVVLELVKVTREAGNYSM